MVTTRTIGGRRRKEALRYRLSQKAVDRKRLCAGDFAFAHSAAPEHDLRCLGPPTLYWRSMAVEASNLQVGYAPPLRLIAG